MKAKVRVAIAGLAHIHASEYIQCIHNNLDSCLIGVWDYNLAEAKKCAKQNDVPFALTLGELIMLKPDFIVVCTENVNHSTVVIDIAKAGIPMLCEKPLGITKVQMVDMHNQCFNITVVGYNTVLAGIMIAQAIVRTCPCMCI